MEKIEQIKFQRKWKNYYEKFIRTFFLMDYDRLKNKDMIEKLKKDFIIKEK